MACTSSDPHADLERLARKRAGAKLGWYAHACVYVLVNLFLAFLSTRSSYPWAVFPALGWGLGLLIHGAAVWIAMPGGSLYAQLLERERAALHRQPPL
ncbi:MAG: 2TM domain-containing protein [Burkholderiaceae bacterium]|nr:2TM domain-containing protein [Burkholderiaceae bacterium]